MAEEFEQTFGPIMRKQCAALRSSIRLANFGIAAAVIAAALMTWCAVNYWLTGHPTLSAFYTVMGFGNFITFSNCINTRRDCLSAIEKWRQAEQQWRQAP